MNKSIERIKLNNTNTVLIACEMIEDEVRASMNRVGAEYPTIWVERGYHDVPDKLNRELKALIRFAETHVITQDIRTKELASKNINSDSQERVSSSVNKHINVSELDENGDGNPDLKYIILAFGLCGKGVVGLSSKEATIVIPRFDDCINIMLCPEKREKRAYMKTGICYMTKGWTDDNGSMKYMYEQCIERYGERKGRRAFTMMYDSYTTAALIDNGCYDPATVEDYARASAEILNLEVIHVPGSIHIFENLLGGYWDDNIIVNKPSSVIQEDDFTFHGESMGTSTATMKLL